MLVCPSDHAIPDAAAFQAAVRAGAAAAAAGALVTFGVRPTRPETGYGWLELAEAARHGRPPCPAAARALRREARRRDRRGDARRTAGTCGTAASSCSRSRRSSRPSRRTRPAMLAAVRAALAAARRPTSASCGSTPRPGREAESVSIDYAVMEKAANLVVVPYAGAWSDLGSWDAIAREMGPDAARRGAVGSRPRDRLRGQPAARREPRPGAGRHRAEERRRDRDARRGARRRHDRRPAGQGGGRGAARPAARRRRPSSRASTGPGAGTRRCRSGPASRSSASWCIPGGVLSLQSHVHRAEHWVVVEGAARVTVGDEVRLLGENQSVYIPLGAVHRHGEPGQGRPAPDRGAVRPLSRRGRHHPLRGRLCPDLSRRTFRARNVRTRRRGCSARGTFRRIRGSAGLREERGVIDRWFFIHIMKTAGTSFRTMLEETLDAEIYPTKAELAQRPRRWYLTAPRAAGRDRARRDRPRAPALPLRALRGQSRRAARRRLAQRDLPARPGAAQPVDDRASPQQGEPAEPLRQAERLEVSRRRRIRRAPDPRLPDQGLRARRRRRRQPPLPDRRRGLRARQGAARGGRFRRAHRAVPRSRSGCSRRCRACASPPCRTRTGAAATPRATAEIARIRALVPYDIELYELAREKLRAQLDAAA